MKIALIGDVHANLHALEAVLTHARQEGAEALWNVGDYLGYGAFPDQVVLRLREIETAAIVGNYDLKVLKFPRRQDRWRRTKRSEKWLAFQWASEQLSGVSRAYLRGLPREVHVQEAGWRVLLTHGSPVSNKEPLTPHTPVDRLSELAELAEAEVVLCGHSHQGFARQVAGVWFINPGSVGRPDDGDPRAAYAILELEPGSLATSHHRIAYDVDGAAAAIRQRQLPEVFAQMVLQGCDFETALASVG